MLLVPILMLKILFAEARVFCQDNNAMAWQPLGLACTITCSTIKTAVEKLKQSDYEYLAAGINQDKVNMSETELHRIRQNLENNVYDRRTSLHPDQRKHIKLYQTYHRLLTKENFEHALKKEAGIMTVELNKTCFNMASKDFYKKIVNIKCTRRLNKRTDILEKLTKFLNIYADPKYPFDEEMAGRILHKLEGNLNLRYGVVDYKRMLAYLQQALRYHKMQASSYNARIIKLQPRNCLTLYKPGCYCQIGYVEKDNECVKPEDCITIPALTKYLERIILL